MYRNFIAASFGTRLVALVTGLTLALALGLSLLHQVTFRSDLLGRAEEHLTNVARMASVRVFDRVKGMQNDAALIAATPQARTLLRDVTTGADTAASRAALEQLLTGVLQARGSYAQVRLIGLAGHGLELARVEAGPEGPQAVPADALQVKGTEAYMQPLMRDTPPTMGYVARVSLNRENGRVAPDAPAMLRYVLPVAGPDGQIEAAVVINAFAERLFATTVTELAPGERMNVVTMSGSYLSYAPGQQVPTMNLPEMADFAPVSYEDGLPPEGFSLDGEEGHGVVLAELPGPTGPFSLYFVASRERAALFAPIRQGLWLAAGVSLLGCLLTVALAVALTRRFLRPLRDLSAHARAQRAPLQSVRFDYAHEDEIGSIARSFEALVDRLIAEAHHHEAVWRNCAEGLLTADQDGIILHANPAVEALFGYPEGELTGNSVDCLMPAAARARHGAHLCGMDVETTRRMAQDRVVHGLHKDGSTVPLEIHISRFATDGGDRFLAVIRDISAERAQKAELEVAVERLRRSNAELDQFAYVASHDLRAPLRVIRNASRWIEEDLGDQLDDETIENLGLMRSRIDRMDQLLTDLLTHSRIGREASDDQTVTGAEMLEEIEDLIDAPDGFTITASESFLAMVMQKIPLQTVLLNLVSNAVKHHDQSTGTVRMDAGWTDDGLARFSVTDDGPGIGKEFHERIFGMFQTLRARDEVEGSGMGLAFVKKIVAIAGGKLDLTSTPGAGSSFAFTWPAQES